VPETDKNSRIAVEELKLNAKSIVSQLNDTIWALNKESLSLTSISDRIKLFLQRMAPSYPGVRLEVRERILNDELLLPYQAFHLFQIVQEAVTNSLKHSKSTNVSVDIESDASWFVNIIDNGKGMNGQSSTSGGGNGLSNMRSRARKSGWSITWQQNVPEGTQVIITPTIN
jgi:signal transduction histidine kinase